MSPLIKINIPSVQQMGDALLWMGLLVMLVASFITLVFLVMEGTKWFLKAKREYFSVDYEKEYQALMASINSRVTRLRPFIGRIIDGEPAVDYERLYREIMSMVERSQM